MMHWDNKLEVENWLLQSHLFVLSATLAMQSIAYSQVLPHFMLRDRAIGIAGGS